MRHAQSMGINLVIIAAIALLVLIIIAVIIGQGGTSIREGVQNCVVKGGTCSVTYPGPDYQIEEDGLCDDGETCYVYAPQG